MLKQDYILLIMNCKKYEHKANLQKNTWLKQIPDYIHYYHVIGDETLEYDFLFDDKKKILFVKTPDDYNSLPKKVIESYNAVNKTFDYQYIFKTDDDQMLIHDNFFDILTKIIANKNPVPHYGGFMLHVQNHLSQYHTIHTELPANIPLYATSYCNGRFYFLSKDAIEYLLPKKQNIFKEYFEDYAIGYNLDDYYKKDTLYIDTNKIFKDM
jgi:hypothetical protein